MAKKKCSYCDATADSHRSLSDQGWTAVVMNIGVGKNNRRFTGRACPDHAALLSADAVKFYNEGMAGIKTVKEGEKCQP